MSVNKIDATRQSNGRNLRMPDGENVHPTSFYCGGKHTLGRDHCPAAGQMCTSCGKLNHFFRKYMNRPVGNNLRDAKPNQYLTLDEISIKKVLTATEDYPNNHLSQNQEATLLFRFQLTISHQMSTHVHLTMMLISLL